MTIRDIGDALRALSQLEQDRQWLKKHGFQEGKDSSFVEVPYWYTWVGPNVRFEVKHLLTGYQAYVALTDGLFVVSVQCYRKTLKDSVKGVKAKLRQTIRGIQMVNKLAQGAFKET